MDANTTQLSENAADKLKSLISAIENLEGEKAEISENVKEVYAEAKALGYDTGVMRKIVARRKKDRDTLEEEEMVLETYLIAIGEI